MDATDDAMIEHLRGNLPEQAAIGVAVGLVCGLVYFGLLWRNAQLFVDGRAAAAAAMQIGRLVAAAFILYAVAHLGGVALIGALAGIVLAREILTRRWGPER